MNFKPIRAYFIACSLAVALHPLGLAQNSDQSKTSVQPSAERDGQHDFDPLIGKWKYHLKRLQHPLTGSNTWVDLEGTGVCYKIWDGRSQLDTIEVDGPTGHIEGLTMRLYNPQSHQWRLYWSNSKVGIMDPPQVGEFKDGGGEFFAQDTINGKTMMAVKPGKSTGSRTNGWPSKANLTHCSPRSSVHSRRTGVGQETDSSKCKHVGLASPTWIRCAATPRSSRWVFECDGLVATVTSCLAVTRRIQVATIITSRLFQNHF